MIPGFEWDPTKRAANLRKHGVDFVRAVRIFEGSVTRQTMTRPDDGEVRIVAVGSVGEMLLTVVYTQRGANLRIISARRANGREARAYRAVRPPEAPGPD
jgi:hypothetical protein